MSEQELKRLAFFLGGQAPTLDNSTQAEKLEEDQYTSGVLVFDGRSADERWAEDPVSHTLYMSRKLSLLNKLAW